MKPFEDWMAGLGYEKHPKGIGWLDSNYRFIDNRLADELYAAACTAYEAGKEKQHDAFENGMRQGSAAGIAALQATIVWPELAHGDTLEQIEAKYKAAVTAAAEQLLKGGGE